MTHAPRQAQIAALIDAEVLRAMAPYHALGLSADVLDELEHLLRFALNNHPTAQDLLRRLLDDPVVARSENVDTTGLEGVLKKKDEGA